MPVLRSSSPYDYSASQERSGVGGYPLFFVYLKPHNLLRISLGLFIIIAGLAFCIWYSRHGSDPTPDSLVGLSYAVVGTVFLLLAGLLYSLRRRSRKSKKVIGGLRSALGWHMFFGLTGLALIFYHSFGNFNPRSGTYALYGLIALVISGIIGRALDRIMPRLIAKEASKALTVEGEDRIEAISQQLQAIVEHNSQRVRGLTPSPASASSALSSAAERGGPGRGRTLHGPWDLAYLTLEETPQELSRYEPSYRLVPDRKSPLSQPGALLPGAQEQIAALRRIERALQREQFYRYVIRYWRIFHILLALVTAGLVIWHLEYAASLVIPTLFH
ncbi:hypothetical protein [Thermogemmatispora sp.]|uniref:DUF350 domain-containing protein n=1 Tax=Thermogemmatispora sp. TaxID=1968838 RepID=UPI001D1EE480|nr:hypothetical protein [Thermogemmatispora sp.]MBX5450364.1 hypothetical protein [Thermogemmatispora sp.]